MANGHSDADADGDIHCTGTECVYTEEDIGKLSYTGGVIGWTYGVDHLPADHNWVGTLSTETAIKFTEGIGEKVFEAVCVHAVVSCDTSWLSGALDACTE